MLAFRAFCRYYRRIKLTTKPFASANRAPKPSRRGRQTSFRFRTWGGKRAGAGRKRTKVRAGVPHVARPEHTWRHPVHITLRARTGLPSLRRQSPFDIVRHALADASQVGFRVLHFSVQRDHVHLLVEAMDKRSLSRGARGLAIRAARAINRILDRAGPVWDDRYHARPLRTPREMRHAIVYVLANWKKHHPSRAGFDTRSSAWWFRGWTHPPSSDASGWRGPDPPVEQPLTWLARAGWRRHGLIAPTEGPTL